MLRARLAGPGWLYHRLAWPVKDRARLGAGAKGLSSILSCAPGWPASPALPSSLGDGDECCLSRVTSQEVAELGPHPDTQA